MQFIFDTPVAIHSASNCLLNLCSVRKLHIKSCKINTGNSQEERDAFTAPGSDSKTISA